MSSGSVSKGSDAHNWTRYLRHLQYDHEHHQVDDETHDWDDQDDDGNDDIDDTKKFAT